MTSTKKPASSAWSDLPSDLFCLILWRLHSLADRVRVAAVCRPWRSAARLQLQEPPLPPLMPWLALGGEDYLDLVTGTDHELRALKIPDDASCGGSVDHLLFLTSDDGGCFLADPFSGAVVPIADLAFFVKEQTPEELPSLTYSLRVKVRKVVVHWPPQGSPAGGGGPHRRRIDNQTQQIQQAQQAQDHLRLQGRGRDERKQGELRREVRTR
ncbi:unnamed protein product [Urochloa humidicola]